ncbi:hypothetical protein SAMN05518849_102113 [Sphingobium sp. AP50]|nr:hypothetical protein SAMN05518849_102113 [Sphingobium sp. AP50]
MRNGVLLLGLVGAVSGLGACGRAQDTQQTARQDNPPPKPPNCPPLPELANLILKDGRIADVRIFRDGETTFYIPFNWFEWEAQRAGGFAGIEETGSAGYWKMWSRIGQPNVHEVECPGTVHVGTFSYGINSIPQLNVNNIFDARPNFAKGNIGTIKFIHIYADRIYNPKTKVGFVLMDQDLHLDVNSAAATIQVGKLHLAEFKGFPLNDEMMNSPRGAGPTWESYKSRAFASSKWKAWRRSVQGLFDWLTTPPKDRDNNVAFKLGMEEP